MVGFAINVNIEPFSHCDVVISLQMLNAEHYSNIFTYKDHIPCVNTTSTISMSGIIVDCFDRHNASSLLLKLVSPDLLKVESSMLNIVEI